MQPYGGAEVPMDHCQITSDTASRPWCTMTSRFVNAEFLDLCEGNPPVTAVDSLHKGPGISSFDVFLGAVVN